MTNSLHFSEWRNCIRAQRKVNLCAPGAPKGPKVGMFVRQYEIVCANDAGRAPRKYPAAAIAMDTFPIYASHAFTTYVISAEFGVTYLYPLLRQYQML